MAEPLNATFFALKHRDRAVLAPATLSIVVILLALVGLYLAINWGTFARLGAMFTFAGGGKVPDSVALEMMSRMFGLIGLTFLFLFPLYLALAAYEAGCLRWIIRGEAPGLFGITLNVDTLRVYSVYWFWFLANIAVSTAASIVTLPLMFFMIGQMPPPTGDPLTMMMWQLKFQGPIMVLQYGALIFVGVRFAPAAATSILRKKFSFFEAWKVTEGRFWALLGSFALLWTILIAANIAVLALIFAVGSMSEVWPSFVDFSSNPSPQAWEHYWAALLSPRMLVTMAIGYAVMIVLGVAYYVLSFGINARAALVALEEGKITPAAT